MSTVEFSGMKIKKAFKDLQTTNKFAHQCYDFENSSFVVFQVATQHSKSLVFCSCRIYQSDILDIVPADAQFCLQTSVETKLKNVITGSRFHL